MMKQNPIWKKWWLWAIIVFLFFNFLVNQFQNEEKISPEQNDIINSNISTH
ncbi:hypothetical protein ACJ2A9_03285 [Anaerobacillus sp. MEB173]|uniref:hypothetical protein n=1 Tax=Anaerobacillus sp. MEB173 TaxID=3383345 RepID=UPI003F8E37DE